MGQYVRGDVLLACVALDSRTPAKTRPVIVVGTSDNGMVRICPVSSKPPSDAPAIPLTLDDFSQGGLDLFNESYVMITRVTAIRANEVIGKRGRVTPQYLAEISPQSPDGNARPGGERKTRRDGR